MRGGRRRRRRIGKLLQAGEDRAGGQSKRCRMYGEAQNSGLHSGLHIIYIYVYETEAEADAEKEKESIR